MTDPRPQIPPLEVEREVHLLDYVHVVLRRWRIVLILFLLIFAGVALKTFLQTPVYQASTIMRVGYKAEASQELLQQQRENRFSIDSEIQVLTSYAIASRAAGKLSLDWQITKLDKGLDIHVRTIEVQQKIDELVLAIVAPGSYELRRADGTALLQGTGGRLTEHEGSKALIEIHQGSVGNTAHLTRIAADEAVGRAMAGVSASELGEGSNMLQLSVQGADPYQIVDIANALTAAYYEQSREAKAQEAVMMLRFINQQLDDLSKQLEESEQQLQTFRIRTGLGRLSPEGQSMVDTAVGLEKQKADMSLRLQRIDNFLRLAGEDTLDFASVGDIPGVSEYVKKLLEQRAVRIDLLRKFTPSHPAVVEVTDQMHQLRESIFASVRLAQKSLEQKIADVERSLKASSKRLKLVPDEELELVRLSRSSQVNAELYSYLLQRQNETRIMAAATTGNVEIIDRAQLPQSPIKPNKKKNLALGLILGLMIGIGTAFLLDYLDRTVKDEEDAKQRLNLSLLGTIPQIMPDARGLTQQLVTQLDPFSSQAEAFLALRTSLLSVVNDHGYKTIQLSSCLLGEGKSTIAANLAFSLADNRARVLLVDCDLRRPALHSIYNEKQAPGLTDLLVSNDQEAIRQIPHTNLDFIPAGTEPPNPTQLLGSDRMKAFLNGARERYDYIIIDAPPLLPVADPLILAPMVDLNVVVLEACRVPVKLAQRAVESLKHHNARIAGGVINDKSGRGARYYGPYSYYRSRYYRGYYRKDVTHHEPLWHRVASAIWNFINN